MTRVLLLCYALLAVGPLLASGQEPGAERPMRHSTGTITDRSMDWPTTAQWRRVLLLQDHNTRVVIAGTAMLGIAAGVIGSFTLLRKRALMGDALSHSMLPGIALAFMLAVAAGASGKALPILLLGATLTGLLGLGTILLLRKLTRLKEDAALGIVLSVFFGAGVAVLGVVQRMGLGHAAGLESFIYGKTASMLSSDAVMIGTAAGLVIGVCTLLFKEFKLLCFDADYAATLGWPTLLLDAVLMGLVVAVTVIGLQAVGLILVIALLIIPAAAARFWTERLPNMILISAVLGAASASIGSAASALWPNLPSGAMIVLVGAILFALSVMLGLKRGVLVRWLRHHDLARKVQRQHLLRGVYELMEEEAAAASPQASISPHPISWAKLLALRSWSPREVRRQIARATRGGLVRPETGTTISLTEAGLKEATRIVRNHRLWELFLITHADIAPSHVDRDADALEHVLDPETVEKLESLLMEQEARDAVPASPHTMCLPTTHK
ncbi:MAG TPA: iron chelate uptake ABC transporter family permease subunit [Clostridia bacterium]|nr:iron chelate uptake ABC transporter family permease subunit [Clostridia bacterium]